MSGRPFAPESAPRVASGHRTVSQIGIARSPAGPESPGRPPQWDTRHLAPRRTTPAAAVDRGNLPATIDGVIEIQHVLLFPCYLTWQPFSRRLAHDVSSI